MIIIMVMMEMVTQSTSTSTAALTIVIIMIMVVVMMSPHTTMAKESVQIQNLLDIILVRDDEASG